MCRFNLLLCISLVPLREASAYSVLREQRMITYFSTSAQSRSNSFDLSGNISISKICTYLITIAANITGYHTVDYGHVANGQRHAFLQPYAQNAAHTFIWSLAEFQLTGISLKSKQSYFIYDINDKSKCDQRCYLP